MDGLLQQWAWCVRCGRKAKRRGDHSARGCLREADTGQREERYDASHSAGYVTGAEQNGGGWVQIVIHHLCDRCDPYSMTLADFTSLVEWLAARAPSGTVVRTTAEVVGGAVKPPVAP